MKKNQFSLRKRLQSFQFAFNGLRLLLKEEHNARIHLFAAVCVVVAGFLCRISALEWIALIFAIGFVFALEIVNSAIENISDFISPNYHEQIKRVKDLAASSVLISTITAVIVGFIIFIPRIITFINNLT